MAAHLALIHYRLGLKGGLESRLYNYVTALLERGNQLTIICARRDPAVVLPPEVEIRQWSPGIFPKLFHLRQWRFSQLVKRQLAANEFDLALSLGRTCGSHAILAAGNHRGYLKAQNRHRLSLDDKVQIQLDDASFRSSQPILAASQMMVDELRALYGVPAEKLHLLYPPLNVNRFHLGWRAQRESLREELGMEAGKKHFLFVSTGHGRKGLPLLLQVFQRLSPVTHHLWVLGSGKPTRQGSLPNVHFAGFSQEAEKWYAAADAMVHPAVYEPFGQVVSESIACGTPVFISPATGAKELIGPAEGRVLPLEADIWEEALANFDESAFSPATDFVQRHRLSVAAHVDRILEVCLPQNV